MDTTGNDAKDDSDQTPDANTILRESHLGACSGNPSQQQPGVPLDIAANTTIPPPEVAPSPAPIGQEGAQASPAAIARADLPEGFTLPPGHAFADLQGEARYEGYPDAPPFNDVRMFASPEAQKHCKRALHSAYVHLDGAMAASEIGKVVLASPPTDPVLVWTPLHTLGEATVVWAHDRRARDLEEAREVARRIIYDQHARKQKEKKAQQQQRQEQRQQQRHKVNKEMEQQIKEEEDAP